MLRTQNFVFVLSKGPEGIQMRRDSPGNLDNLLKTQWQFSEKEYKNLPALFNIYRPDTKLMAFAKSKTINEIVIELL